MRRLIAAALAACLVVLAPAAAFAQAAPTKYDSAATTNSTEVNPGLSWLQAIVVINENTTVYYLKFYDTATAPACNTATVKWKIPVPYGASNAGGGVASPLPVGGLTFQNGIGFCLTGGRADSDNTNAATGVTINLGVKQ